MAAVTGYTIQPNPDKKTFTLIAARGRTKAECLYTHVDPNDVDDIKGPILALTRRPADHHKCTQCLLCARDGCFAVLTADGKWKILQRIDVTSGRLDVFKQGGSSDQGVRDFIADIYLQDGVKQALLDVHSRKEAVGSEVFGNLVQSAPAAPLRLSSPTSPTSPKNPNKLVDDSGLPAMQQDTETEGSDDGEPKPAKRRRKEPRISSGAAAEGLAGAGGRSSSISSARQISLPVEPVGEDGCADSPALQHAAPGQQLIGLAAAAAATAGGRAEAPASAAGSLQSGGTGQQTLQQPLGAAAVAAIMPEQQLQVPEAALVAAGQQQLQGWRPGYFMSLLAECDYKPQQSQLVVDGSNAPAAGVGLGVGVGAGACRAGAGAGGGDGAAGDAPLTCALCGDVELCGCWGAAQAAGGGAAATVLTSVDRWAGYGQGGVGADSREDDESEQSVNQGEEQSEEAGSGRSSVEAQEQFEGDEEEDGSEGGGDDDEGCDDGDEQVPVQQLQGLAPAAAAAAAGGLSPAASTGSVEGPASSVGSVSWSEALLNIPLTPGHDWDPDAEYPMPDGWSPPVRQWSVDSYGRLLDLAYRNEK